MKTSETSKEVDKLHLAHQLIADRARETELLASILLKQPDGQAHNVS